MTGFFSLDSSRAGKSPPRSALPMASPASSVGKGWPKAPTHLLPSQPDTIPIQAESRRPARPRLEIGAAHSPLESEANAMASTVSIAGPAAASEGSARSTYTPEMTRPVEAPAVVHEALNATGQPLDPAARALMEPRLGSDLGAVRIHTGQSAADAARSVEAQAYTVGKDIFFGAGRYRPQTPEGRRLLAHELSHTVQQSGGGPRLSSAAPGLYRDPVTKTTAQGTTTDTDTKKPKNQQVTVPVPPNLLPLLLTPPSLLQPQQKPLYSPGTLSLGSGAGASPGPYGQLPALGHPGASLFQPPSQYTPLPSGPMLPTAPASPALSPTPSSGSAAPSTAPKAPESISLYSKGRFSIGARIGLPDPSKDIKPGDPPSALQESIKKSEIINFTLTGQLPSEYSIDPGKLVGALWGIFATQIDPSAAAKIAAAAAAKPHGGGASYELDAAILLDLGGARKGGGAGATLTVTF